MRAIETGLLKANSVAIAVRKAPREWAALAHVLCWTVLAFFRSATPNDLFTWSPLVIMLGRVKIHPVFDYPKPSSWRGVKLACQTSHSFVKYCASPLRDW